MMTLGAWTISSWLAGCGSTPPKPADTHLLRNDAPTISSAAVPPPVGSTALPPRPRPQAPQETYSVVVHQVEVNSLLFALARDARINVDIHPGIQGVVTLNAINQTLPQLLNRISKQVDIRYEFDGKNLVVLPDQPFLRQYRIDYVNVSRDARAAVNVATQIATAGGAASTGGASNSASGSGDNNSTTSVVNVSNNRFWETLIQNVRDILRETDRVISTESTPGVTNTSPPSAAPATAPNTSAAPPPSTVRTSTVREAASVIANPETGMLVVRATQRQHERVQEFLDQVLNSARRQVLIEATVVEVQLSDQYQQGINWQRLRTNGTGWSLSQQPLGPMPLPGGTVPGSGPGGFVFAPNTTGSASPSLMVLNWTNPSTSAVGNLSAAVSLLESFGKVKVLSSPKISALNNQTALLKVVDNKVYFTVEVQITPGTANTPASTTYTTTANTVPVGFVMSVTPQIDDNGMVTMNVRPSISRITGYVNDPSPPLAQAGVVSRIPEIQTRELESVLKIPSGQIAVMGGLMQDSIDNREDGVPVVSSVPGLGNLFRYRNEQANKSELVIFLRPLVIRDASLDGDYKSFRVYQPGADFFTQPSANDPAQRFDRWVEQLPRPQPTTPQPSP